MTSIPNKPPQRFYRIDEVLELTSFGRTKLGEEIQKGRFPRPVRLSERRKAWAADDLAHWQADRIRERDSSEG